MGFVKIDRNFLDNWIYKSSKPFCKGMAWIDLILFVYYADSKEPINGEFEVTKRGSRWTSAEELRIRWGWSSKKKVLGFLRTLERAHSITLKGNTKGTLVTVVNYGFYNPQGNAKETPRKRKRAHEGNANGTAEETPRDTDKRSKEVKNKKEKINKKEMPTFFEWIASHEAPFESVEQRNKEWDEFRAQYEEDG